MNATPNVLYIKFGWPSQQIYPTDLSDLRDKINGFSGDTGISAKLSYDRTCMNHVTDGYDIVIDDFDMSADTAAQVVANVAHNGTSTNMYLILVFKQLLMRKPYSKSWNTNN